MSQTLACFLPLPVAIALAVFLVLLSAPVRAPVLRDSGNRTRPRS